jgi:hypothetical protein
MQKKLGLSPTASQFLKTNKKSTENENETVALQTAAYKRELP